jgi:hypothetical protein
MPLFLAAAPDESPHRPLVQPKVTTALLANQARCFKFNKFGIQFRYAELALALYRLE